MHESGSRNGHGRDRDESGSDVLSSVAPPSIGRRVI